MNDVEELAQRIAQSITNKAMIEKDIANPAAYTDKILQSLVAKHAKRGTGWLVEQGIEHGLVIPASLAMSLPEKAENRRPAACQSCGIAVYYDSRRPVHIVQGWPIARALCARGYLPETCSIFAERGLDITMIGLVPGPDAHA